MKDRKLLIPVRSTTRKFYLHHPPPGRNDWHVRFTPPAINGSRRVIFRSTGTKEIAAAKGIASQIIESFWNDAGRGAEPLKLRNDNATIGELIERYERNAVQRLRTIRGNVRSLRLIVKTVHNGDPDQKPTTVLTSSLIRDFEKRRVQRAEKRATAATHAGVIQRTRNSTASFVRQARSIVALVFHSALSFDLNSSMSRVLSPIASRSPKNSRRRFKCDCICGLTSRRIPRFPPCL